MREYSREEINTLWRQAYHRAISGGPNVNNVWILALLLLFPVGLFGFPISLLIVWLVISITSIGFALHVRKIWESSVDGNFPASTAIIRMLINSALVPHLMTLCFALVPFGAAYLEDPNWNYLPSAIISIIIYVATIPIANLWAKQQTNSIIVNESHIITRGLQIFSGWMRIYFWACVTFLGGVTYLSAPGEGDIGFISFPFPGFAIFFLVLSFGNIQLFRTLSKFGLENSLYQKSLKEVDKHFREERKARRKGPTRTPVWCAGCDAQGEIEVDDPEGNYYVICEVCGTETAEVWCDEGVGGQFVLNIHEHPFEYDCEICKKTHQLPADFYEKPVTLELIEEPRKRKK